MDHGDFEYLVDNGVYHLGFGLSKLERKIINMCCEHLESRGLKYLSIPSCVSRETIEDQGMVAPENVFKLFIESDERKQHQHLSGSAEQGILEFFCSYLGLGNIDSQYVNYPETNLVYAVNQCFRNENFYDGLMKVKEFIKVEQYCLCDERNWEERFQMLLQNATDFLDKFPFIEHRIVDRTKQDPGYHIKKYDIEVKTKEYGWLETHSCTYFGNEQIKRMTQGHDSGEVHTISNTGIATPRILIPFIENGVML